MDRPKYGFVVRKNIGEGFILVEITPETRVYATLQEAEKALEEKTKNLLNNTPIIRSIR